MGVFADVTVLATTPEPCNKIIVNNYQLKLILITFKQFYVLKSKQPLHLKNGVFWDVPPCGYYKNRLFEGTYRLHHYGDKTQ
jgi:hypothetical protein